MTDPDVNMLGLAARQGSMVTRRQLLDAGLSGSSIGHRLRTGRLAKEFTGLYRVRGLPTTPTTAVWTAVLSGGAGSVASHATAAALHGCPVGSTPVEVTVPHGRNIRPLSDVTAHQSRLLGPRWTCRVDSIPTTSPARTVIDLARTRRIELATDAAQHLVRYRRLDVGRLVRHRAALSGRPWIRCLDPVLDALDGNEVLAESELEVRLHRFLVDAGFDGWIAQAPFPGRCPGAQRVDVAFPAQRVVVEADGRPWHTRVEDLERDNARTLSALAAGWVTVRTTNRDLTTHQAGTARRLREALGRRVEQPSEPDAGRRTA